MTDNTRHHNRRTLPDKIIFHILYSFFWLVTRLPFSFLYAFSSLCFPLVYYILPYRKKVVLTNLHKSFPEWDKKKVREISKKFYRQFCDSMIESFAFNFLDEKETLKRMKFKNPELINELYDKGKSVALLMAHYGNWELSPVSARYVNHEVIALYKPLSNKSFDDFFLRSRQHFGAVAVPMDKFFRYLTDAQKEGKKTLTLFLSDQRPHWSLISYWTKIFNQDAPVYMGAEKIARKFNMAAVYFKVTAVSRGHYEAEFVLLKEDSKDTQEHEITELYLKTLENHIREAPEYWLWTHKRWKYGKKT